MEKQLILAYLAGLFDGEGCVSITTHKYKDKLYITKTLIFTQADKSMCELFKKELAVGRVYCKSGAGHIYDWRANNYEALYAAKLLLPYLRIKREQIITKIIT